MQNLKKISILYFRQHHYIISKEAPVYEVQTKYTYRHLINAEYQHMISSTYLLL